jgi:hypothetical protein
MSRTATCLALAAASLFSTSAFAAARTYVASFGSDANTSTNCSPTSPCRTFTAAMGITDAGGEIIVLDSAGYGRVTIAKSLSIIAPAGIYAGLVAVSGQNAVDIATAGVNVVLKGLTINGQGAGGIGINMTAGNRLTVENCEIANFVNAGIYINGAIDTRIVDTVVRDLNVGIQLDGGANATIAGVKVLGVDTTGIWAMGSAAGTSAHISDSVVKGKGMNIGILANATVASTAALMSVTRTVVSNSGDGISAYTTIASASARIGVSHATVSGSGNAVVASGNAGTSVITIGQSLVTGNSAGLRKDNVGVLKTTGNNTVADNTTDVLGPLTTVAPM